MTPHENNHLKRDFKSQITSSQKLERTKATVEPQIGKARDIAMVMHSHTSARAVGEQMNAATLDIVQNNQQLEKTLRYHSSPIYARGVDAVHYVSGLFGNRHNVPSLAELLDAQDEVLGNYAKSLTFMTQLFSSQYAHVVDQVDSMEISLQNLESTNFVSEQTSLKRDISQTPSRKKRRALMDKLYDLDRSERSLELSTSFFDQYVAQELLMRDAIHSLELLSDKTQVYHTYIQKSKGFFATVDNVGEAVSYMVPMIAGMRQHTNLLQNQTSVIVDYLHSESDTPLFSGERGIQPLPNPRRRI